MRPTRRAVAAGPATCRIFRRGPDGQSLSEPLTVSIDLSEIAFTEGELTPRDVT
jgi:hypothetical protein